MPLCVLTGDIVGSTGLTHAELIQVRALLAQANDDLQPVANAALFDTHRGDGWQATFPSPQGALRFALYFRATLGAENSAYQTRVAIAEGSDNLGDPNVKTSSSTTFIASGRALDAMPGDQFMAHASGGARHAATLLADHISRDWTQSQARAIRPFLHPAATLTQKDVAQTLGISRQAVGQALDAAGYPAIKAALHALEEQSK